MRGTRNGAFQLKNAPNVYPYLPDEEDNNEMFTTLWGKWEEVGNLLFKKDDINMNIIASQLPDSNPPLVFPESVIRMVNQIPLSNYNHLPWFNIYPKFVLITEEYRHVVRDVIDISHGRKNTSQISFPPQVDDNVDIEPPLKKVKLADVENTFNPFFLDDEETVDGTVILAGQCGIGKSTFLYFVVILRILAGLPTILELNDGSLLAFTSEGFFRIDHLHHLGERRDVVLPSSHLFPRYFPPGTWYCFDSTSTSTQIRSPCCGKFADFFFLQTASSDEAKWKESVQGSAASLSLYYMQPPSVCEILIA
ncbi:hypothetical protein C8Q75DRAFT_785838 [Abortiporus biennis]|nr:hypothetical protein C8Q75DRAFT_785838 [Abortiporus biennis]